MSVLEWLGLGCGTTGCAESDVIRRIVRELEAMDPSAARHLALFAFLLSRVANVDQDVSDDETRAMEAVVETYGGVSAAQATLVVQIAKTQNRLFGETRNSLAAREFRDHATEDQTRDLLHCLFAVSGADEAISVEEEEAILEISRELLVTNDEYLAIRSAYRDRRPAPKPS